MGSFDYVGYWQKRYMQGGTSGQGSYGESAQWKAKIVNSVVQRHEIVSVLEFGCGDGNQLSLYDFKTYTGLDVSAEAVKKCQKIYSDVAGFEFHQLSPGQQTIIPNHDLVICIEVLMHITDESDFVWTLDSLFSNGARFVLICTPMLLHPGVRLGPHEKHRNMTYYFLKYIDKYDIVDFWLHPSVSVADRIAGRTGEFSSDFTLFRLKR